MATMHSVVGSGGRYSGITLIEDLQAPPKESWFSKIFRCCRSDSALPDTYPTERSSLTARDVTKGYDSAESSGSEQRTRTRKKKRKPRAPSPTSSENSSQRSVSPPLSTASTLSNDSSRSVSPEPEVLKVQARFFDSRQGMAHAIHGMKTKTVTAAPVKTVQPEGASIARFRKRLESESKPGTIPTLTVSHRMGDRYHVTFKYQPRDESRGWERRGAVQIPAREVEALGSSRTTAQMDLGAHLKAHLLKNFQQVHAQF